MCGRARCTLSPDQIIQAAGTTHWIDQNRYDASYNLSPGRFTPVVYQQKHKNNNTSQPSPRCIHTMAWGLIPSVSKNKPDHYKMFNARSEELADKPSFRPLIPQNRCIVYLNGFYEWIKEHGNQKKQPYYIYLKNDKPMAIAALYDAWKQPNDGTLLFTFTILTTSSSEKLSWLHDRMPVILEDERSQDVWLDIHPGSIHALHSVMKPYNGDDLMYHKVTKKMNNASFDNESCCAKLKEQSVTSLFSAFSAKKKKKEDSRESIEGQASDLDLHEKVEKDVPIVYESTTTKKGVSTEQHQVAAVAIEKKRPISETALSLSPPIKKKRVEHSQDQPAISLYFSRK